MHIFTHGAANYHTQFNTHMVNQLKNTYIYITHVAANFRTQFNTHMVN